MCNDEQLFMKMETLKKPLEIVLGDGHVVKSQQQGTVSLMMNYQVVKAENATYMMFCMCQIYHTIW